MSHRHHYERIRAQLFFGEFNRCNPDVPTEKWTCCLWAALVCVTWCDSNSQEFGTCENTCKLGGRPRGEILSSEKGNTFCALEST